MQHPETVVIVGGEHGYIVINKEDFDETKHERIEEPKKQKVASQAALKEADKPSEK